MMRNLDIERITISGISLVASLIIAGEAQNLTTTILGTVAVAALIGALDLGGKWKPFVYLTDRHNFWAVCMDIDYNQIPCRNDMRPGEILLFTPRLSHISRPHA